VTRRRTLSWTSRLSSKLGEFKLPVALQHRGTAALAVAPALSTGTRSRMPSLSLLQVRTLIPRLMTSNRARHELIQLPTISVKVRLPVLGARRQSGIVPGTVPDLSGDGDAPPSPSRFVRNRGLSPVLVPDLAGTGTLPKNSLRDILLLPRPRFPSGGPRPVNPSHWFHGIYLRCTSNIPNTLLGEA
jgi:hypothetical protein